MTDTSTYEIGDRVRYGELDGAVVEVDPLANVAPYGVRCTDRRALRWVAADELELIDESTQVDGEESVAMSASVAGSPDDDASSTGSQAEPEAKKQPWIPPLEPTELGRLEAKVEHAVEDLTELVERYGLTNTALHRAAANDLELIGRSVAIIARSEQATTTRRTRINVTKNTKGYSYDTTFELTSSEPAMDFRAEVQWGLKLADEVARQEIERRLYTDEHGPPGADDDRPF